MAGLAPASGTAGRRVTLTASTADAVDAACPPAGGERVGGLGVAELRDYGAAGLVWRARHFGDHRVDPDGRAVECAPPDRAGWEPFLTGQVLPLCAALQGLEVLHAGAVTIDGAGLVVTGASGAGKSSVVAALVDAGSGFVTDDVAAVELTREHVLVHPGPALLKLRGDFAPRLARIGRVVAEASGAAHIAVARETAPAAVAAVAVLSPGSTLAVEATPVDPMLLLGANFIPVLRRPARLERLLDVCARLAAGARMLRVTVPRGADPRSVAEALRGRLT